MSPTSTEPIQSAAQFLELLYSVQILSEVQLERAVLMLPPNLQTANQVADALVRTQHLTPFQSARLLHGKREGYLLGPYLLLEQLSIGRMGRVYKAMHRTMNRTVAVKILASELTRHEEELQQFFDEARSAAKLIHPNVVTVLDVNQIRKRLYLVMEYVDGAGADWIIRHSGPMEAPKAFEFIRQAALGLQHAHDHEIIHGAIGPSSLLIGRPGGFRSSQGTTERLSAKLCNFGLRAVLTVENTDQSDLDPVDFRAPETFEETGLLTEASDVYSLGCVLVYVLTGQGPFPGLSLQNKIQAHQHAAPPNLHVRMKEVPPAVANLLLRMLAKAADRRPSAAEVAAVLLPYADSNDPTARIDFNLVTTGSQQISLNTGFLTGLNDTQASLSITDTHPPVQPSADPSPWSDLSQATQDGLDPQAPVTIRVRSEPAPQPASSLSSLVIAVAITICIATFIGILLAIRHFAR